VPASFFPCHSVEVFLNEFGVLSAVESSPVATRGGVAFWKSWEASETMAMSMYSLESPLEADPVILVSFPRERVRGCISCLSGLQSSKVV
jgi:hypothetical protein